MLGGPPSFWIYFYVCIYAWVCICNCPGPSKIMKVTPITLREPPGLKKWEAWTPARKPASALSRIVVVLAMWIMMMLVMLVQLFANRDDSALTIVACSLVLWSLRVTALGIWWRFYRRWVKVKKDPRVQYQVRFTICKREFWMFPQFTVIFVFLSILFENLKKIEDISRI